MKLLCFETSAKAASVALFDGQTLLGESYQNTGLTHSQTILAMAEQTIKTAGLTSADVRAVAVAAGPGSFTGVRIGMAAAKGFAWGNELPLYGVSTLEGMARGFAAYEGFVCPVMDARRNQVYNALFHVKQSEFSRITPDRAISLAELSDQLRTLSGPVFLVGDGSALVYRALAQAVPSLVMPAEHRCHQRAVGVGLCALDMIARGEKGDALSLVPNYLRLSQAERERAEKEAQML